MKKRIEKRMPSSQMWAIIGIIGMAVLLSKVNGVSSSSGFIVVEGGQCPDPKDIASTAYDSSNDKDYNSGTWKFKSGDDKSGDALKACKEQADTVGESECDDHCNGENNDIKCDGKFKKDPDEHGKAASFVTKNVVDDQVIYKEFIMPISKADRQKVVSAEAAAATCKVNGKCECTPTPPPKKKGGDIFDWFLGLF